MTIASATTVIGTCVESLDDDGLPYLPGSLNHGAGAVCHFMYYLGLSETTRPTKAGTQNANWGETRYLSNAMWGDAGSYLTGANIQSAGIALTSTDQGFVLGNTSLANYVAAAVYTMTWYQPEY